jgi:protein tyrosine phosphatase (PTP) superfamily phosphohydrolase (DUF442 family)
MIGRAKPPEQRWAARQKRIAMWDQPITDGWARLRAWWDMLVVDHGFVRIIYPNEHKVDDQLWRSAQPNPSDIEHFARQGVRTVVNLRGGREHGAWPLQKEACEAHGLALEEITLRSREAPDREMLLSLPAFFAGLRYPALAHCKSGADRAGLFAALYLLVHLGASAAEAKQQLSWRYGHARMAPTGVLDVFLETYEREGEARGIGFIDWVRDHYDPAAVKAAFKAKPAMSFLIDKVLRRE